VAAVLETGLTAAGIPHDLKVYPGVKHAFFNGQWRAYHLAAAVGTPSPRVDGAIPRLPFGMVSGTPNEREGEHCHREPCDQQGRGSGRMAGAQVGGIPALLRPTG